MRRSEGRRGGLAALAVLAVHGLLFWALRPRAPAPPPAPPSPVAWLRLVPAPAPQAQATPRPAPVRAATLPSARPAPPPPVALPSVAAPEPEPEPQAITPPPVPSPPPSLILALPPATAGSSPVWREQMLRDPRANSRPARSATGTLQSLAGDGRRREQTLAGEGRRRVRIDGACVEVHEARMAQLDPHNQSTNPLPAQVRPCD